jgi:hypothetical protein
MYSTRMQRAYPSDLTDAQWERLALAQIIVLIAPSLDHAGRHCTSLVVRHQRT